jgi:probable dihydroxyacetone kinase regulator
LADSNITKRALAQALKELIETQPFDKISVGSICSQCGLNRKSFYYHFRDKYDLVNWIYYTEFIEVALKEEHETVWSLMDEICHYFYENRIFYNKTFHIEGQNSFSEYFSSMINHMLSEDLREYFPENISVEPYAEFYTDAFICSIKKWLSKKDCIPPDEFTRFLRTAILGISHRASQIWKDQSTYFY